MLGSILIVGAGPAGIISACVYNKKYPDKKILWVDQNFNVGKLSSYPNVYANTPYKKMIHFINTLYSLIGSNCKATICNELNNDYFKLSCLCNELKKITEIIIKSPMITAVTDTIVSIKKNDLWNCRGIDNTYMVDKVLFATGCEHKSLSYNKPVISIQDALNPNKLIEKDFKAKNILVFGNSHSGILILKNLYDCGYKNIICIYKSPIKIPYIKNGVEIFDQSGLRGVAKDWSEEYLLPNKTNIKFIKYNNNNINDIVNECDYIIYAIGLKQAVLPRIETPGSSKTYYKLSRCYTDYSFDPETGEICKGIYGIGVGFPAHYILDDNLECKVGIYEFLERANEIL